MTKEEALILAKRKVKLNNVSIVYLKIYYDEFLKGNEVTEGCLKITELVNLEMGANDENRHRTNDRDTSNIVRGIRKRERTLFEATS